MKGLIGTQVGIVAPQLRNYHARTLDALNWLSVRGEWLSIEHEEALDRHIRDLHGEGNPFYVTKNIWSRLRAIYPMIGSSALAHSMNIKDLTKPLTFTGTMTHSATGVAFNGGYGETGLTMVGNVTAGAGYYSRTDYRPATFSVMFGGYNVAISVISLQSSNGTYVAELYGNTNSISVSSATLSSVAYFSMSRTSSTDFRLHRNGVQIGSNITPNTFSPANIPVVIGAFNAQGTITYPSLTECAYANINNGLTPAEEAFYYESIRMYEIDMDRANLDDENLDGDVTNYITSVNLNGGHISCREALALSQLVKDFKTSGSWNTKFAVYPFVGKGPESQCINLRNPASHKLTFQGNIMCNKTGTIFDGFSGVALTDINPFIEFPNSGHISFYSRTRTRDKVYVPIIGSTSDSASGFGSDAVCLIIQNPGGTTASTWGDNSFTNNVNVGYIRPDGWWVSSRNGTNQNIYTNARIVLGKNFGTNPHTGTPLAIGGFNVNGAIGASGTFRECTYSDFGLYQDAQLLADCIAIERMQFTLKRAIYDADVRRYVGAVYANGGFLSEAQWNALHDNILEMKRTGIWHRMIAIYPMMGGNAACHTLNLKDISLHPLVFTGTITHSATGCKFDGATGYARADFSVSPNTTYGSGYYSRTDYRTTAHTLVAAYDASTSLFGTTYDPANGLLYDCFNLTLGSGRIIDAFDGTNGFISASRISSTDWKLYISGVQKGISTGTMTDPPPINNFTIGAATVDNGLNFVQFSPTECAWVDFNIGLSPDEELIRFQLVENIQIASGRDVTPYHTQTQIAIDYLATQSVTLTKYQKGILDRLVRDLNGEPNTHYATTNIWNKFLGLYPFIGGTAVSHALNIKNTARPLTFAGGIVHSATGADWDGTSGYANTGIVLTSDIAATGDITAGLSYYSREDFRTRSHVLMGTYYGIPYESFYLLASFGEGLDGVSHDAFTTEEGNGGRVRNASISTLGLISGGRISNTDHRLYQNGIEVASNFSLHYYDFYYYIPTHPIAIAASDGSAPGAFSPSECAYADINTGLTPVEEYNRYNAVQAYQIGLGREIIPTFDIDAQIFFNAVVANGGTLNGIQKTAISDLVTNLKLNGTWTRKIAIYPMVGGTAASHAINLKNPSLYKLTFSGAMAHSDTGCYFQGGSALTGIVPNAVFTANNMSMNFYSRNGDPTVTWSGEIGSTGSGGANPLFLVVRNHQNTTQSNINGSFAQIASLNGLGLFTASHNGGVNRLLQNGLSKASISQASPVFPATPLTLGAINTNGVVGDFTTRECAYVDIGLGYTAAEVALDYADIRTYQVALNRSVAAVVDDILALTLLLVTLLVTLNIFLTDDEMIALDALVRGLPAPPSPAPGLAPMTQMAPIEYSAEDLLTLPEIQEFINSL